MLRPFPSISAVADQKKKKSDYYLVSFVISVEESNQGFVVSQKKKRQILTIKVSSRLFCFFGEGHDAPKPPFLVSLIFPRGTNREGVSNNKEFFSNNIRMRERDETIGTNWYQKQRRLFPVDWSHSARS
jgi:hypothetical protein